MARIYGQLERAQLENLGSDPAQGITGRIWVNTVDGRQRYDDGTLVREVVTSGGPATAANKIVIASDSLINLTSLARVSGALYYGTDTGKHYSDDGIVLNEFDISTPLPNLSDELRNATISVTEAAGAITIALKNLAGADPSGGDPVTVSLRDPNALGGVVTKTVVSALSLVIPSGAELGNTSGSPEDVYVGFILNAANSLALCVIGESAARTIDPVGLKNVTLLDTSSDNADTIYSSQTTANQAFRYFARFKATHTVGVWASPTDVEVVSVADFVRAVSIDSQHFVAGGVDTAAIDALAVTTAKIGAAAVTTAKIKDENVTYAKLEPVNFQSVFLNSDFTYLGFGTPQDVAGMSFTLTDVPNRPIMVGITGEDRRSSIRISQTGASANLQMEPQLLVVRDGTVNVIKWRWTSDLRLTGATWQVQSRLDIPVYAIAIDFPGASASYTYQLKLTALTIIDNTTIILTGMRMFALVL